jgi:UDP-N-acetylmuramoyl-tripeptide--D-alanyl-D-alanine ligase
MNNNIGMPMTILELNDENAMVVEMGMNHFGEIELLTDIAKPTIAVITNIGTAHIGNLGSRENILKAKLEILDGMKKKILVINNDNDLLHKFYLENKDNPEIEIHTYGIENKSEVMGYNIKLGEDSSWFDCKIENDLENKSSVNNVSIGKQNTIDNVLKNEFSVEVPVGGLHFVYNSLCAITVANLLNLNQSEIKCGIKNFVPTKNRMDITKLKNGVTIINDSYNASFDSMQMLLNYLSNFTAKRRIAVLGDMLELGDYSKELHEKVGKEVAKNNVDILIVSGENSKYIAEKAIKDGINKENVYYFDNGDKIYNFIKKIWRDGDCILFKASNGMRFFEIADKLIAECGK